jgi:hypothetical protein
MRGFGGRYRVDDGQLREDEVGTFERPAVLEFFDTLRRCCFVMEYVGKKW